MAILYPFIHKSARLMTLANVVLQTCNIEGNLIIYYFLIMQKMFHKFGLFTTWVLLLIVIRPTLMPLYLLFSEIGLFNLLVRFKNIHLNFMKLGIKEIFR